MMLYRLSELKKAYSGRTVLDISSLEVEAGQVYALLGPNGAGKTTLLNMLAFLDVPSSGEIYFQSQKVRHTEVNLQQLRKKVVMVDQHPIMFSTSVFKNIEFGLKTRGVPSKLHERIIEETLDWVGMRRFISAPAHRLSGGETQRVALARALALSPDVFLCDEPTSGIDAENRAIVIDILRQINKEKQISLIFTTHDRTQASALTPRILVLEGGRLTATAYENVFTGAVEKLADNLHRIVIRNDLSFEIADAEIRIHDGPSKFYIDPAGLKIVPVNEKPPPPGSIPARVISAAIQNDHVRVEIDAGVTLTALLSDAEYRRKKIMVGDAVQVQAPPESIRLL